MLFAELEEIGLMPRVQYSVSSLDDEIFLTPEKTEGPTRPIGQKSLTDKSIILDLDLTLICTIGDGSDLSDKMRTQHRKAYDSLMRRGCLVPTTLTQFGGSGKAAHNDVIKRPGMDQFLTFCKYVFKHVILWSAGQASYVYDVVRLVVDPQDSGIFDRIYTAQDIIQCHVDGRAACSASDESRQFSSGLKGLGYTSFSTKPINKITEHFPDVTAESTVIVDDLPCNFMPNPRNGVLIPPFSPQLADLLAGSTAAFLDNMCDDFFLFSLLHFFADDAFLKIKDVREYDLAFFKGNKKLREH